MKLLKLKLSLCDRIEEIDDNIFFIKDKFNNLLCKVETQPYKFNIVFYNSNIPSIDGYYNDMDIRQDGYPYGNTRIALVMKQVRFIESNPKKFSLNSDGPSVTFKEIFFKFSSKFFYENFEDNKSELLKYFNNSDEHILFNMFKVSSDYEDLMKLSKLFDNINEFDVINLLKEYGGMLIKATIMEKEKRKEL